MEPCDQVDKETWVPYEPSWLGVRECVEPSIGEVGVEVEKAIGGMKAKALTPHDQG